MLAQCRFNMSGWRWDDLLLAHGFPGPRYRAQAIAQVLRENEFIAVAELRKAKPQLWLRAEELSSDESAFLCTLWDRYHSRFHLVHPLVPFVVHLGADSPRPFYGVRLAAERASPLTER